MLPHPLPRKLVQISEEALPPMHVPLILGNDFFIFTQQDVRKVEESRFFSISKLMGNGDLKSIDVPNLQDWSLEILKQENLLCNQNLCQLVEFLNVMRNSGQEHHTKTLPRQQQYPATSAANTCPQPMEVSTPVCENRTIASIEQQLQWNKFVNTSAPFPMTYSHGTSTTEINYNPSNMKTCCCCCCINCQRCGNAKLYCNKSTDTRVLQNATIKKSDEILGAREQLKKKKLNFNFGCIT